MRYSIYTHTLTVPHKMCFFFFFSAAATNVFLCFQFMFYFFSCFALCSWHMISQSSSYTIEFMVSKSQEYESSFHTISYPMHRFLEINSNGLFICAIYPLDAMRLQPNERNESRDKNMKKRQGSNVHWMSSNSNVCLLMRYFQCLSHC